MSIGLINMISTQKYSKPILNRTQNSTFWVLICMLVSPPIMRPPIWDLPFEIMCDASDYTVGAVLGQREDKKPYVIYYTSKTLDSAQRSIYGFKHAS